MIFGVVSDPVKQRRVREALGIPEPSVPIGKLLVKLDSRATGEEFAKAFIPARFYPKHSTLDYAMFDSECRFVEIPMPMPGVSTYFEWQ